jgi:hypothetical protein
MTKIIFRTPIRRKTRQKSGFNVSGNSPGSECKIRKTGRLNINDKKFEINFIKKNVDLVPLFLNEKSIISFGAYLKPKKTIKLTLTIKYILDELEKKESAYFVLNSGEWNKVGVLSDANIIENKKIDEVKCHFLIESESEKIGILDIFGINMDSIKYPYFIENEIENIFLEKMSIYIPEISYHSYDEIISLETDKEIELNEGEPIIIKSCNRCSRFLPIDVLNERNTLSFSNHCVKKAPCTHNAFSRYTIKETDYQNIPSIFSSLIDDDKIKLYNGYQLECKSCKKFFVNAPLNPLRNSTQHREDSLRRRAIEVLVDTLLEKDWIYHKFRIENKKEFDKHIWEKFGKKCFKCSKQLKNEREMDLDHTMPLASFWGLDETATCLCKRCNSLKSDKFPVQFYTKDELKKLAEITKLPIELISIKKANKYVIEKLIKKVDWFFDTFLSNKDYQKVRGGKRTSDLIFKAIQKQLNTYYSSKIDLISLYKKKTGKLPKTITL